MAQLPTTGLSDTTLSQLGAYDAQSDEAKSEPITAVAQGEYFFADTPGLRVTVELAAEPHAAVWLQPPGLTLLLESLTDLANGLLDLIPAIFDEGGQIENSFGPALSRTVIDEIIKVTNGRQAEIEPDGSHEVVAGNVETALKALDDHVVRLVIAHALLNLHSAWPNLEIGPNGHTITHHHVDRLVAVEFSVRMTLQAVD